VTDEELRLLGNVTGRRVLQLGCADPTAAIAVAAQGAHVIAVVDGLDELDGARRAAERAEQHVELHHGDLADLAFIRADTVDAAFSEGALRAVEDLDRVFRQVHRVLRTDAPLVLVLPHPAGDLIDGRSYFDRAGNRRTIGDLFASLSRAHFAVDTLLEPDDSPLPRTLVLRGRKLGN
jgi:SAM-dependent methyltransferase